MPETIPDDLPYSGYGIECHRFGARRGGASIGCCAVDIIQGFVHDPDAVCPPIPFFDGDSRAPILDYYSGKQLHLTGTNEEVFLSYIMHGSFTQEPVADHAFIAVLTEDQCNSTVGQKWLRILHREGFQHVATSSNGVYCEYHPNHIFILVRSTHEHMEQGEIEALGPPEFWKKLEASEAKGNPEERFYDLQRNHRRDVLTYLETGQKAEVQEAEEATINPCAEVPLSPLF